jgi:hypothetical protein
MSCKSRIIFGRAEDAKAFAAALAALQSDMKASSTGWRWCVQHRRYDLDDRPQAAQLGRRAEFGILIDAAEPAVGRSSDMSAFAPLAGADRAFARRAESTLMTRWNH